MSSAMRQRRAHAAYGQATETVARAQQLVMLHDGIIRRLREARQAAVERRIEDRFQALRKAGLIVDGLQASLDPAAGGDLARQLERCYLYLALRLQQVNIHNDAAICDELIERVGDLRSAWAGLVAGQPAATAVSPAPPMGLRAV